MRDSRPQLPLQTIGEFSRSVGLSPSALRDYAGRGLLSPSDVTEHNGYRYYAPSQQRQAIWIRRLRDAGLGLERIRIVLEGDEAASDAVLDAWVDEARTQSVSRDALARDLRATLRVVPGTSPVQRTAARLDGATLGAALRQVARAGSDAAFGGVLVEIGADVVTVAATDRSVLLARTGIPAIVDGPPARARVLPQPAVEWLPSQVEVHLSIERATGGGTARVLLSGADGDALAVDGLSDLFPGVAEVIDADAAAGGRAVFDTTAVRDLLEPARSDDVALVIEDSSASLRYDGRSVRGRAIGCTTTARSLSCRSLRLISEAVVGPELLCDLRDDGRSLLWRDAAQPDFAGLMLSQQP